MGFAAGMMVGGSIPVLSSGEVPFRLAPAILVFAAPTIVFLAGVLIWLLRRSRGSRTRVELENRYRGMIEETSDIIHIVSPDGKFLYVNRAWRRTFGYTDEEMASLTLMDLLHPDEREKARRQIGQLMVQRQVIEIETRFVTKDGRTVWVEGNSTCELSDGEVVARRGLFHNVTERQVLSRRGIFHNVTERKQAEADRARLLAILAEAPDFIATFTPEGKVLWINRAFRQLRNLNAEADFSRLSIGDFYPTWANHLLAAALPAVLDSGIWKGESAVLAEDGREVPVSQTMVAHHDESGRVAYLSTLCRDITESRKAEGALREAHVQLNLALQREKELSRTDTLTGLANRRAFYEALQAERARASRYNRPLTLAYVDLDNFKHVNDTLGHATGDELLACVAATLRTNLRASDSVGRLGGDEFALLLPETSAQAAESLLKKLDQILKREMVSHQWPVTFSIGAAAFLENPPLLDEMIRMADEAMYRVKKSGKNKISVVLIGGSAGQEAEEAALTSE